MNLNVDTYIYYADSLAHCGRISEAFEIYNYINNNICGHLPLARLKNLSQCLIDYVLRISNEEKPEQRSPSSLIPADSLLCQICSPPDILRCPVTVKCGHTFCKECCDKTNKCPVCNVYFDPAVISISFDDNSESPSLVTTNACSSTTCTSTSTTTTITTTFPTPSLVTSSSTDYTTPVQNPHPFTNHSRANQVKKEKHIQNVLMPDILVRQIVEKWWSEELYARQMNDLTKQYVSLNLLDEALKFCNQCLEKFPNNFQTLLLRAEILHKLHHYQSSLADTDKAIKMQLLSPNAFYQKAQTLAALNKFEDAFMFLCLVICLDSKMEIVTTSNFEKNLSTIVQKLFDNDRSMALFNGTKPCKRRKIQFDILKHSRLKKHFKRKGCKEGSISDLNVICNIPELTTEKGLRFRNILIKTKEEIRKLKDNIQYFSENHLMKRHVDPRFIDTSDFDCILCCRTLWKPVVTQCGHTYCWVCLTRCLDYSSSCPLCKSSLLPDENNSSYVSQISLISRRPTTKFLEVAMQLYIPSAYESRKMQEIDLEPSIPVFICTTAFPCVSCPLFVYEPKYRLMVRRCIESGERKFGIVQSQHKTNSKYFDIGTLLEIRDCILLGDGCSILSTVGCKRFKIISRNEKDGYETARIDYIRDSITSMDMLPKLKEIHNIVLKKSCFWFETLKENLKEEILRTFGKMPIVEDNDNWLNSPDGPSWAWWIIAILPLNQQLKVAILGTTCLEKRLKAIEKTIDFISGHYRKPGGSCVVLRDLSECNSSELCQALSSSNRNADPVIDPLNSTDIVF